jgi:RHS repeat-associated protein
LVVSEDGTMEYDRKEQTDNITTWVYELNSFTPCGKYENGNYYSIVSDYLGTPVLAFNAQGRQVWHRELDCYGRLRQGDNKFVPFLYPGQYVDLETGLAYNRFRYYDVESGNYLSQDPIGLNGGMNPYNYVHDTNEFVDIFGLSGQRWLGKTKKDGTPYNKPGPKSKGSGDHNAKIEEIINRESAKEGVTHIGGGSKTEVIIDTQGGHKPYRRMDASFERVDGSKYHINVGRTLDDGVTGISRERQAIDDVRKKGHDISFEGYGKAKNYK